MKYIFGYYVVNLAIILLIPMQIYFEGFSIDRTLFMILMVGFMLIMIQFMNFGGLWDKEIEKK